jgi:hypothetical protein
MSHRDPKQVVQRLIEEVMNNGDPSALDELYAPRLVPAASRWIEPFLDSFSDIRMRIVELVAEGETVAGRFACSGTHLHVARPSSNRGSDTAGTLSWPRCARATPAMPRSERSACGSHCWRQLPDSRSAATSWHEWQGAVP